MLNCKHSSAPMQTHVFLHSRLSMEGKVRPSEIKVRICNYHIIKTCISLVGSALAMLPFKYSLFWAWFCASHFISYLTQYQALIGTGSAAPSFYISANHPHCNNVIHCFLLLPLRTGYYHPWSLDLHNSHPLKTLPTQRGTWDIQRRERATKILLREV